MDVTVQHEGNLFPGRFGRMAAALWPTIFGPQHVEEQEPVERIVLPPEPMFKAPDDKVWSTL